MEGEVGIRIKELRKKLGLTQREFGRKIGVMDTVVRRWEKGEFEPTTEKLKAIATEFGINLNWLLLGEGEIFVRKESSSLPVAPLIDRELFQRITETIEKHYKAGLLKGVPEEEVMEMIKFLYKKIKPLKDKEEAKWREELQKLSHEYVKIFLT